MGNVLLKCAGLDLIIQWLGWATAAAFQTEKFYDLTGSATFILLVHLSRVWAGTGFRRQKIQTGLVTVWALRLGLFLFLRILRDGHDRRFHRVRNSPGTFFVYWTMQALWVFVTLLPTLILNSEGRDTRLGLRDLTGWSVWLLGFITEVVADHQKSVFKSNPQNAERFISSGLWSYSRHPNYLGEILQWSGLFLSASTVMRGPQKWSVLSPIFVWFLLRHVSGVPILERSAHRRWGSDPRFREYISNTPLLWPLHMCRALEFL